MSSNVQESNITRFQRRIEDKYQIKFEDYWDFHKWSVENYEKIWAETFAHFNIIHSQPYTKVIGDPENGSKATEWFVGARLNYTENILRHKDGIALLLLGEERDSAEEVTYQQLIDEVSTMGSALRKAGIKPGDIIACYMSTRKETMVCKLVCGAIGAIFTAVNPLMGSQAVISRLRQVSPKVLFTIDRHRYNNEEKDVLKLLPEITKGIPDLEQVIIVPSNDQSLKKNISHIPNSCFYPNFISNGLQVNGKVPDPFYEQLPFSHPFVLSFTSGTTGPPKGIVHSAGAALLAAMREMFFSFDIRQNDVMFLIHVAGWASFNIFSICLAFGTKNILYEGLPYYNEKPSFWDLIDKYGVTTIFLTPTVIEEMDNKDIVPGSHNSLKTLRIITSGSCPVKSYVYDIVHNRIKKDVFFSTLYGCTELFGMVVGTNCDLPVHKEEIQAPSLGVDLLIFNESGESVLDQIGEIVVSNPWPSVPTLMWKDNKFVKYSGSSLEKFPGVFWIGDMGMRNSKTGGLICPGRCDETIKNRGARFGSSEIYGIVNKIPEVDDSICVSRIVRSGHEVAALFIKMKQRKDFTPDFVEMVKEKIKEELSLLHIPPIIVPVNAIPLNLNGKRMETLVKKILAGEKNLPTEAIMNPESIGEYLEYATSTY